mgnify:FL=1
MIFFEQVKLLCTTRWGERHTTMAELRELYPHILAALEQMSGPNFDKDTSAEAHGLRNTMMSDGFIAAFIITEHMLGYTFPLSKSLQGK